MTTNALIILVAVGVAVNSISIFFLARLVRTLHEGIQESYRDVGFNDPE